MLAKTQETLFYKLDWAQRENEMYPEAMKKVGTEWQAGADAMGAQQNVGPKVRSLVLMANKNWGFDNGLNSRVEWGLIGNVPSVHFLTLQQSHRLINLKAVVMINLNCQLDKI